MRILITISLLFCVAPLSVSAIGVSPSAIVVGDVDHDYRREYEVTILRAPEEDAELTLRTAVTGPAAQYISLDSEILLAEDEQKKTFSILIDTGRISPGEHEAFVSFSPRIDGSSGASGSGQSVSSGIVVPVQFQVSDEQQYASAQPVITLGAVIQTDEHMTVSATIKNPGQLDWRAEAVTVTVDEQTVAVDPGTVIVRAGETSTVEWALPFTTDSSDETVSIAAQVDGEQVILVDRQTIELRSTPDDVDMQPTDRALGTGWVVLAALLALCVLLAGVLSVWIQKRRKTTQ